MAIASRAVPSIDGPTAPFVHATADVSPRARVGNGTRIWRNAHVREGASIGEECNVGQNVYVDADVTIGDRVKIGNNASVYRGAVIEDGVFIGPHAILTNDRNPRSITPDGRLKGPDDWDEGTITVRHGASVGAGAIVVTGVVIGEFALIGAGSVVTRDVPAFGLVRGNPARLAGTACCCGRTGRLATAAASFRCPCGREHPMPAARPTA
jgi:UDP-2-acetamido-3-amino-2,3-dideoxy-glucuronate N-acetyltransferase